MDVGYKIFDTKGDDYLFLYHGINKSRKVSKNKWLTADRKLVSDGSNKNKYEGGFHFLKTLKEAKTYLTKFSTRRKNKVIIKVGVKNIRKKPTGNSVWLADELFVDSNHRPLVRI